MYASLVSLVRSTSVHTAFCCTASAAPPGWIRKLILARWTATDSAAADSLRSNRFVTVAVTASAPDPRSRARVLHSCDHQLPVSDYDGWDVLEAADVGLYHVCAGPPAGCRRPCCTTLARIVLAAWERRRKPLFVCMWCMSAGESRRSCSGLVLAATALTFAVHTDHRCFWCQLRRQLRRQCHHDTHWHR